jgi:DNA modification methylase
MVKYLYSSNNQVTLYKGNNLDVLKTLPEESINCVVTSPPYYGLRDYDSATWIGGNENCSHISNNAIRGVGYLQETANQGLGVDFYTTCPMCNARKQDDQIGLESTPGKYVENMVQIFREIKRVLAKNGTVWLNLGDSYATTHQTGTQDDDTKWKHGQISKGYHARAGGVGNGYKRKDLMGIPWKVAFALQDDGWYLRQDIIWSKPAPMPESVTDRCTKSHEYIFLLAKSEKYYYNADAIKEPAISEDRYIRDPDNPNYKFNIVPGRSRMNGLKHNNYESRNKRDVWSINTSNFPGHHFAVFPQEIPMNCIKAGTKEGDVVLDPFAGSGTTLMVAQKLNRKSIGIDIKNEYLDMCLKRTKQLNLL